MSVKIGNPLEEYFKGFPEESFNPAEAKTYPHFRVVCAAIQRCPPRHERFEYVRDMGMTNIEKVFNGKPLRVDHTGTITFVFPERWMSVQEAVCFMDRLNRHPSRGEIKRVEIITSSPYIIGSFYRTQVHLIQFADDEVVQ